MDDSMPLSPPCSVRSEASALASVDERTPPPRLASRFASLALPPSVSPEPATAPATKTKVKSEGQLRDIECVYANDPWETAKADGLNQQQQIDANKVEIARLKREVNQLVRHLRLGPDEFSQFERLAERLVDIETRRSESGVKRARSLETLDEDEEDASRRSKQGRHYVDTGRRVVSGAAGPYPAVFRQSAAAYPFASHPHPAYSRPSPYHAPQAPFCPLPPYGYPPQFAYPTSSGYYRHPAPRASYSPEPASRSPPSVVFLSSGSPAASSNGDSPPPRPRLPGFSSASANPSRPSSAASAPSTALVPDSRTLRPLVIPSLSHLSSRPFSAALSAERSGLSSAHPVSSAHPYGHSYGPSPLRSAAAGPGDLSASTSTPHPLSFGHGPARLLPPLGGYPTSEARECRTDPGAFVVSSPKKAEEEEKGEMSALSPVDEAVKLPPLRLGSSSGADGNDGKGGAMRRLPSLSEKLKREAEGEERKSVQAE
ncbi:hypothetical protein JCM8097_000377 [Rhodosporidiobolus ruineniae]